MHQHSLISKKRCEDNTMKRIQDKDISVVIQGPISSSKNRFMDKGTTKNCIESVRKHLPSAMIILSTWEGEAAHNLEYDRLITNKDPGSTSYQDKNGCLFNYNVNRQIISTLNGLNAVDTTYAIKLRTDNIITNKGFLNLFEKLGDTPKESILTKRLVSSTWFARNPRSQIKYPFHPSDLFFFGLTKDLINLWDIPLSDLEENDLYFKNREDIGGKADYSRYTPEQYIWVSFLKKNLISLHFEHYRDTSNDNIVISEKTLAQNLIIAEPEAIGIASPKHQKLFSTLNLEERQHASSSLYSFEEWLLLHNKYCDNKIHFTLKNWAKLILHKIKWGYQKPIKNFIRSYLPFIRTTYRFFKHAFKSQNQY